MGKYHCWYSLRRKFCAAITVALTVVAGLTAPSTSVAEDIIKATNSVTPSLVSEPLVIATPEISSEVAERLSNDRTDAPDGASAVFAALGTNIPNGYIPLEALSEEDAAEYLSNLEPALPGSTVAPDIFTEDEEIYELILELNRKGKKLSNTLIGIQRGFDYYLPITEIARAIRFPSQLNIQNGTINGTFFNSQNTYKINAKTNSLKVRGETIEIPKDSFFINDLGDGLGDIYAKVDTINKIWPLRLEIDFAEQAIRIKTPKLLPYELELKRKERQALLDEKDNEKKGPKLERVENKYTFLSPHTFNLSNSVTWDEDRSEFTRNLNISGRGDLLGASANYTINLNSNKDKILDLTTARLALTREDHGDGTALPLGLRSAKIGDVSARPSKFVSRIFSGRGLSVSTSQIPNNQDFDEVIVEGTAQPGWETELYRGAELLDFGFVDKTGIYRFTEVPLNYGNNEIRVVLYGPQGQTEERTHSYNIKRSLLKPGQSNFEASIMEQGRPLFDVQDSFSNKTFETTKFLRVNRGISHWLTGFFTATQTPTNIGKKDYLTLGANFNALGGTGQIELYKDLDEGTAIDGRFSTNFAGVNTVLRSAFFNNFESQSVGFGDFARTYEGEVRANKSFELPFAQLGLNFDVLQTNFKNGKNTTDTRFAQTLSKDGLSLSHSVDVDFLRGKHKTTEGSIALNAYLSPRWNVRTVFDYTAFPESEFDASRINIDYNNLDKFKAGFDLNQGLGTNNETTARLKASYDFDTFLGSTDLTWDKDDGLNFMLRTSTTLGPDGDDGEYAFSTDYSGYITALKIRLYHDKDRNGEFDNEDELIKGARVFVDRRKTKKSDEHGLIEILGAGRPRLVSIILDQESVPNPYLDSAKFGYKTVLRQGTKPFIDIPLIETGIIDGTVRSSDGRQLPGMTIQLINQYGQLAGETTTVFDGFYTFELVKPGRYIVQVHPSHRVFVPTRTVTVASEDLFAYGVDLQILKQAKEAPVVIETDGESGGVAHTYHAPATGGTELLVSKPSGGGVQPVVRAVRIGEHPHKVRLVLDLSEPTRYLITKDPNGSLITIDLPNAKWGTSTPPNPKKHSIFSSCDIQPLAGGGTQIRLKGRNKIDVFYNALLPPENGKGNRLYIDFMQAK